MIAGSSEGPSVSTAERRSCRGLDCACGEQHTRHTLRRPRRVTAAMARARARGAPVGEVEPPVRVGVLLLLQHGLRVPPCMAVDTAL